jgi:hypothetical protein
MSTPVIVHLPAQPSKKEFFTLDESFKVFANVMTKLGHTHCLSGFDIRFSYLVDPPPDRLQVGKDLAVTQIAAGR